MLRDHKSQNQIRKGWTMLVWVVVIAMLLGGCGAPAQAKVYKVGILVGVPVIAPIADGFKAKMADLGYIEGKNIVYDTQITNFDIPTYQSVLKKFVDDKVDLIVVTPTEATVEAKAITQGTNIPVVFTYAFTEGTGIIDSVRAPGGNITGVRFPGIDIAVQRLEVLLKIVPQAKRIWIPYQRGYPTVASQLEGLAPVAKAAGVTLIEFPTDAAGIQTELAARSTLDDVGMDAMLFLVDPIATFPGVFEAIGKFAYEHKIPFGGIYDASQKYSSLFGVNTDLAESGRLAAPLVDKVLKGIQAGTIPVVTPENIIQINFKAAPEFGLTVPEGLLLRADEVIR
jgi:putative tryptophan/tyrosine transport system substrate-binding protein